MTLQSALGPLKKLWSAFASLTVKDVVVYSLSLAIPFLLEHGPEILKSESALAPGPIFSLIFSYQRTVTAGPRKPRPHFVRLVMISKDTEPDEVTNDDNPCPQRPFIARLLRTLEKARPALIVIDKYYSAHRCSRDDQDEDTLSLQRAVSEVSASVPIILGAYE